jgi:hypothetical protein
MTEFNLEMVDVDGAIREGAEEVSGDTRMGFLRKAGLAGGAALSGGAVLGAIASPALAAGQGRPPAKFGKGDIGILNYALTLEYLESAFYNQATSKGIVKSPHLKQILKTVTFDENYHVKFLKSALGSNAVGKPKFDFGKALSNEAEFAATAYVLENTGVHAYLGQAGNIMNGAYLIAAAEIVTIEARHSGALGLYLGEAIAPKPLDSGWTASKVLAAVGKTGFIVG